MKVIKFIFKKWYLAPVLLFVLFESILNLFINPRIPNDIYKSQEFESKSFKVNISTVFIKGDPGCHKYIIKSIPYGLLNEIIYCITDCFMAPIGLVFGNFDFDSDNEILVICDGSFTKTKVTNLKNNKKTFVINEQFLGYYDYSNTGFIFKQLKESPLYVIIMNRYIDGLGVPLLDGIFATLLSCILWLFNLFLLKIYKFYSRNYER